MKISGIYKIQSLIKPLRIYIGSTANIGRRWNFHLNQLKKNKHENKKLQNHFNKYGIGDLQFTILLGCNKEELIKVEQYFIDTYNPYFNICKIAGSPMKNRNHSLETRKKISEKHKGIKLSEEHKNNMKIAWKNRKLMPVSEKSKQKMKESSTKFYNSERGEKERERRRKKMTGKRFLFRHHKGTKVINIVTNEIFDSIRSAAKSINMKERTLHAQLRGESPNRTNFKLIA